MPPVTLPVDSGVECPPLPDCESMHERTVVWWETTWASPMAAMYLSCDVPALERLATLLDRVHRGELTSRLLSEVRSLEDRFGLSPMARLRLQWQVEPAAAEQASVVDLDDERFLRAVKD